MLLYLHLQVHKSFQFFSASFNSKKNLNLNLNRWIDGGGSGCPKTATRKKNEKK